MSGSIATRNAAELIEDVEVLSGPAVIADAVLDRSSSMTHVIEKVNRGMEALVNDLRADETAVDSVVLSQTSFGGDVRTDVARTSARGFSPAPLTAGGNTPMGEAIRSVLDSQDVSLQRYSYEGTRVKVPWIVMLTDGEGTDEWRSAAARTRELAGAGKLNFLCVYLGQANVANLREFCAPEQPPLALDETKFSDFFSWLSMSLINSSRNQAGAPQTPPVTTWVAR